MLEENIRIRMWYYNPDDIIWSLAYMAEHGTIDSLPMFNFYLDCVERDIQYTYHAYLVYSGEVSRLDLINKLYFYNDDFNYFMLKQVGELAPINFEIMKLMGLHFAMSKIEIRSGEKIKEEKILLDPSHKYSFGNFQNIQRALVRDTLLLYKKYSNAL